MGSIHLLRLLAALSVETATKLHMYSLIIDCGEIITLIVLIVMIIQLQKKVGDSKIL